MKRIAVIGGGASGLFAAVSAAESAARGAADVEITVFEAQQRVGKKLLVTGNGRCNLSNQKLDPSFYEGDALLVRNILLRFGQKETLAFFRRRGLITRMDEAGRLYPRSNQATSVLDLFRSACDELGVRIRTETHVSSIARSGGAFLINGTEMFDAVIVSCGSPAGACGGRDPTGLFHSLGMACSPFFPALCPLIVRSFTKSLKGVRAEGKLSLFVGKTRIAEDRGELQYTEQGLSGIPAMQASVKAAVHLNAHRTVEAVVDSYPEGSANELLRFFLEQAAAFPHKPAVFLLSGILHKRLGEFFLREEGAAPETELGQLPESMLRKLVREIKEKKYTVERTAGMRDAQVAVGGVKASELDPETLEAKAIKKLYVCGEAVDVVGVCGGYNLQWAWSSGYAAGTAAVRNLIL